MKVIIVDILGQVSLRLPKLQLLAFGGHNYGKGTLINCMQVDFFICFGRGEGG